MRDLERYRAKRDPARTPEPFGGEAVGSAAGPGGAFAVQQHAARRMHWDVRLEVDGVLASWSVPRGPSLDAGDRRLAVRTEDHPLEYADFEGVIPAGNYGAGAMILWDRGIYRLVDEASPTEALEAGKLDLLLIGHKLRGRFALVRTRGEAGRDWLLVAKGSRGGGVPVVEELPASVLSGLRVEELAAGASRDAEVEARLDELAPPRQEIPAGELRPMLASREAEPFSREGWLFELKYDGARLLAEKRDDRVRLLARSGADRTAAYPELARAVARLPLTSCVVDGEVVALDESGRSRFERLQRRFAQTDPEQIARLRAEIPVQLQAFDLLSARGRDLRGLPLSERKALLARFVPRRGFVCFSDHVEGDGRALFEAASEQGLEGVVAKRANSRYESGRRSKAWLKIKVPRRSALAVVGWLPRRGSRDALGSLVVAWNDAGKLRPAGRVGSGLDARSCDALLPRLRAARLDAPALDLEPEGPLRDARWVRPEIVCAVRYTEVTEAGLLRHPVFEGLREDLAPGDCAAAPAREADLAEPVVSGAGPRSPRLTRREKVFWPVDGYTKGDLLAYYEAVWPWLEPYLRDRPLVLTRYPDGIDGKHFYQKNAPEFTPDWVRRENIDGTDYFVCNDVETLLYVVNSGAIPLHVWSARVGSLDRPDWLLLDLDPKDAPFAGVVAVARHLHALLGALRAPHFVKTSGQDGLHVLLPLGGRLDHADARGLAEVLARVVCAELPDRATIARPLAARGQRVYVDFLQNGRGKLVASPLSVRPRPGAPVSMPLTWRQVGPRLDPARWTLRTAPARLRRRSDPLRGVLGEPVDVEALLRALSARLGGDVA